MFKSIIIKHAWKRCDIISINSNIVLKFLKKKHAAEVISNRFITASSDFDNWLKRTSRELRSMRKNIKTFQEEYEEIDEFEVIYGQHQIFRFFKAIEQQSHALKFQTKDLNACLKVAAKKKARDRLSKTMIIKSDVIIVGDIRKSYSEHLKKWIIELEDKIKKKIKKINKINNSEIVRNVALFAAEKITFEFARLRKEINELNIQIAADDAAKKAEANVYEKA